MRPALGRWRPHFCQQSGQIIFSMCEKHSKGKEKCEKTKYGRHDSWRPSRSAAWLLNFSRFQNKQIKLQKKKKTIRRRKKEDSLRIISKYFRGSMRNNCANPARIQRGLFSVSFPPKKIYNLKISRCRFCLIDDVSLTHTQVSRRHCTIIFISLTFDRFSISNVANFLRDDVHMKSVTFFC
jgi:hypothetical protein